MSLTTLFLLMYKAPAEFAAIQPSNVQFAIVRLFTELSSPWTLIPAPSVLLEQL